jgi:hypothetical protein
LAIFSVIYFPLQTGLHGAYIFLFKQGFTEYRNLDKCFDYIEELMIKEGPFDGLMGFSQVTRPGTVNYSANHVYHMATLN